MLKSLNHKSSENVKRLNEENTYLHKENKLLIQALHISEQNKRDLLLEIQILKEHTETDAKYIHQLREEVKLVKNKYNKLSDDSVLNLVKLRYEKDNNFTNSSH